MLRNMTVFAIKKFNAFFQIPKKIRQAVFHDLTVFYSIFFFIFEKNLPLCVQFSVIWRFFGKKIQV
jgi:hypothetical protein